jgi:MoaA/NifB/PqqE/SkfB family radical SAM enzyme
MENKVTLPEHYNYAAVFLTLACNLTCSYCINHLSGNAVKKRFLKGPEWLERLNRLELSSTIPLTIQGGEPTTHPHFYDIINGINKSTALDLLTNVQFDTNEFIERIPSERFRRDSKYASIRVSFHPETMDQQKTLTKVIKLQEAGFSIGIFGIAHPKDISALEEFRTQCVYHNIDFRYKDFLGTFEDKVFGEYKYPDSVFQNNTSNCLCKTSELLIAPDGKIHRCHHDLYNNINPQGDLVDHNFKIEDKFLACDKFGKCNPCDVKIKNNRLQEWGHTSVEIQF